MKKMMLIAIVVFAVCLTAPSNGSVLTDDAYTIGLWHMDSTIESGGETYVPDDTSVTGRSGYDLWLSKEWPGMGDPTLTTGNGGKYGEALVFDTDFAIVDNAWNAHDSIILDFWMNVDQLPTTSGVPVSYLFRTGAWDLGINGNDKMQWTVRNSAGDGVGYVRYDLSGMEDQWIHVVATFDPDLNVTLTVNDNTVSDTASEMWWLRSGDDIQVGYLTEKDAERGFKGMIDELKISVIPEPATLAILGLGFISLRRRK